MIILDVEPPIHTLDGLFVNYLKRRISLATHDDAFANTMAEFSEADWTMVEFEDMHLEQWQDKPHTPQKSVAGSASGE